MQVGNTQTGTDAPAISKVAWSLDRTSLMGTLGDLGIYKAQLSPQQIQLLAKPNVPAGLPTALE